MDPKPNESREDFVARCIHHPDWRQRYKNGRQRRYEIERHYDQVTTGESAPPSTAMSLGTVKEQRFTEGSGEAESPTGTIEPAEPDEDDVT